MAVPDTVRTPLPHKGAISGKDLDAMIGVIHYIYLAIRTNGDVQRPFELTWAVRNADIVLPDIAFADLGLDCSWPSQAKQEYPHNAA